MTPRGIRNHNPGNIRLSKDNWRGLAQNQTDTSFCVFTSSIWGIRALAKVLLAYQTKHRLKTVREIINRWAPPVENDTGAYVASVADRLFVKPDQDIDLYEQAVLTSLVEAIIKHENGIQPYGAAEIDSGIRMALA